MNLETAIELQDDLTDLANLLKKGCKGHWKNFGFSHGYGSYDIDFTTIKTGDNVPKFWYTIVATGEKKVFDYMYQISCIINKYADPSIGWHIDYKDGQMHTLPFQINIP